MWQTIHSLFVLPYASIGARQYPREEMFDLWTGATVEFSSDATFTCPQRRETIFLSYMRSKVCSKVNIERNTLTTPVRQLFVHIFNELNVHSDTT